MILDKVFGLNHRTLVVTGAGVDQDATLKRVFGRSPQTRSRVRVVEETPMTVSSYFAAVRYISWTTAFLPLRVFRREGDTNNFPAPSHPVDTVLNRRASLMQNAMMYRATAKMHEILWGNSYAFIERSGAGQVNHLWQIPPWKVTPEVVGSRLEYKLSDSDDLPEPRKRLFDFEIVHIPGIGFDGRVGQSLVSFSREAVGEAVAAEQFAAGFYGGGAAQNIALRHPGRLKGDGAQSLREQWRDKHNNPNAGPAVLEEGMDVATIGIPQKDAQYIESRRFFPSEASRWTGVRPHKVSDLENATFSNIAEQNIESVQDLLPWMRRDEQEYNQKLFSDSEREVFFVEHVVAGLLAADPATQSAAFSTALQNGWMNRNEVRRLLNMNSIGDEGDIFTVQVNLTPLDKLGEEPEPEPEPAVVEDPDQPEEDPEEEPAEDQGDIRKAQAKHALTLALRQMIHKQCAQLRHLLKTPEKFVTRATEFHDRFRPRMKAGLVVACEQCNAIGVKADADKIANDWIDRSHEVLLMWAEDYPLSRANEMAKTVTVTLGLWEHSWAEQLATDLFGENHE